MAKCIFVTGTDTGIGKTICSAAIALKLSQNGKTVAYLKPVECGIARSDKSFVAHYIKDVYDQYKLKTPISPHLAAKQEGIEISISEIKKKIVELSSNYDYLVVEGAGGLLVPITESYDFAKLISELEINLILVTGSKLGVLNHAKLNFEYIRAKKLKIMGYVFNEVLSLAEAGEQVDAIKTNRKALERIATNYDIPELFALPFFDTLPDNKSLLELMDNTPFSAKIRDI